MTGIPFIVSRIALERTVRLVTTARLREAVLLGLAGQAFQDDLAEIEGATSGRLVAQQQGTEDLQVTELEHVPPQLNQGDSRGAEDGRGYRH